MQFIEEKINAFKNKEYFAKQLGGFKYKDKKDKIIKTQEAYIETGQIVQGLERLSFFYDYPELKKLFRNEMNKDWDDAWLDLKDLNIAWASAYLEKYQRYNMKELSDKKIISEEDWKVAGTLRLSGVPDNDTTKRDIYFQTTFFDLKAATLHGVAACELMAEFALFDAIRMSKDLVCDIHYIRFPSKPCEELNAIVLGDWPKKDCLIVCPWLGENGEIIVWQGSLKDTLRFSGYSEVKVMYKISPGEEMNKYQKVLAEVNFLADTKEKIMIRGKIESISRDYVRAFDQFFLEKKVVENQSTSIRKLGR